MQYKNGMEDDAGQAQAHPSRTAKVQEGQVVLPDGRKLAYLAAGSTRGLPLFHFHGHGSSRMEALVLDKAARAAGISVWAFDRPGIGGSDPCPGDCLSNWPMDVFAAADQLGIHRFLVQGMSAGAAYALACADHDPQRIIACSLVSPLPPPPIIRRSGPILRRWFWWMAARFPNFLEKRLQQIRPDVEFTPDRFTKRLRFLEPWLGGEDHNLLKNPEIMQIFAQSLQESTRQSNAANRRELLRLAQPWGFDQKAISVPLFLWHGEQDRIVLPQSVRRWLLELPDCQSQFYAKDGHFSVLALRSEAILQTLQSMSCRGIVPLSPRTNTDTF